VALFEIGHVYRVTDRVAVLPDERELLSAVLAGRDARAAVVLWQEIESALLLTAPVQLVAAVLPGLHATRTARLVGPDGDVGVVGEIDPDVLAAHGVTERVAWLEVDLDRLLAIGHGTATYQRVSRFPSSDLDLAFTTPDSVTATALRAALATAAGPLLAGLDLFDVYRGEGVTPGSRSLAWRLRLQADDRTLVDTELTAARDACIAAASSLGATLRA
jgi:phenylalanyl-tRNA synthetase beta chain